MDHAPGVRLGQSLPFIELAHADLDRCKEGTKPQSRNLSGGLYGLRLDPGRVRRIASDRRTAFSSAKLQRPN